MLADLIRALLAAGAAGVLPGYFWAKLLCVTEGPIERLTYSAALSMALVPALALAQARLLGSGVTLSIAVVSASFVLVAGLAAYLLVGPDKASKAWIASPTAPLGLYSLVSIALALAIVAGTDLAYRNGFWAATSCGGWPSTTCSASGSAQRFMVPVALLLAVAGIAHRLASSSKGAASVRFREEARIAVPGSPAGPARLLLPAVLLLVLARGYVGVVLHDWPFVRGVDQYSHAVMANLMLSKGEIYPYLIYPPGFHTLVAVISRFSGLDPLRMFPVLGPALLVLPALSCYALANGLWGWKYGVAAAFLAGVTMGGSYYYFQDAMYPNLVTAQFLLVLTVASLIRVYTSPSARSGLLLALLGSSVVLYHQVSSLYLALLLSLVSVLFLPYLLLRERRTGFALLGSLTVLGLLSVAYAWSTYDLPKMIGDLLAGSGTSTTETAVNMVIGTQQPYGPGPLIGAVVSQPVAWLGLLGALLAAGSWRAGRRQVLAHGTLILWALLLFAGSLTSLSGFPQRFGRDLGVPLSILAAFALVAILRSLVAQRRPVAVYAASVAVLLVGVLTGLRAVQSFDQSSGPSWRMTMTPQIAAAGEWLREHNTGGNIMVSPEGNQVPSRMMLAMGHYSAFQSFTASQIETPRDLPPTGPGPLLDVLRVMDAPASSDAERILDRRDVRYIVLYKYMPDRPVAGYWYAFKARPDLYRTVFENGDVLIVAPRDVSGAPNGWRSARPDVALSGEFRT